MAGLSDDLAAAITIAEAAGELLRERFLAGVDKPNFKGSRRDVVTAADVDAERLILGALAERRPEDSVLAEESGSTDRGSDRVWCVDPLDGTTNFAAGVPHFAVALCLAVGGEPRLAVTHDPLRGETGAVELGGPTLLNGGPVSVRRPEHLEDAVIADNLPLDNAGGGPGRRPLEPARGLRESGSMALDLLWVAAGRFDAMAYRRSERLWDYLGGELLVLGAGGAVRETEPERHFALAGHPDFIETIGGPVARD
ncbi:MAG: inositol monophosphatase [Actinobacteria bacterium]|nr:inositol monophosphatase [Actinomycetota bacterium]